MPLFTNKYQKTGFIYSLTLSFIYLPLLLGILDTNKFIPNDTCNLLVFIIFSVVFATTINYKIILTKKNRTRISNFLLTPLNIAIMFLIFVLLPFEIELNVFILSLVFLGIPWFLFYMNIWQRHVHTLQ